MVSTGAGCHGPERKQNELMKFSVNLTEIHQVGEDCFSNGISLFSMEAERNEFDGE